MSHYQWRTDISTVMNQLFRKYQKEGIAMPYTVEDFRRERREEVLRTLTRQDLINLLEDLPFEEFLRLYSHEKLLKAISPEERLRGLSEKDTEACLKILMSKQRKKSAPD